MMNLTPLEKAMQFAAIAHRGVMRKVGNVPFLMHPMEAAVIVASITDDQDVMAAALLHDTVEDTATTAQDILDNFGDKIARLVLSETEDKLAHRPASETWRIRKEASLVELRETNDRNVKILWLADKLSNIRSFYRQYLLEGDSMWQHYNQKDKTQHEWYYRSVADALSELDGTAAMAEYRDLLDRIFGRPEGV